MEKRAKLEKAIEVFVLIAFPIALIVGCAGSGNVQPELESTQDISAIEQRYEVDVVATTKGDELVSESNSELEVNVDETTDDIVMNQFMGSMMKVTFSDDAAEKNEVIVESDTVMLDQPALLVLADTSEDVLVAGANSTLALMNDIELPPNYLVFNFDSDSAKVHEYDRYFLKQHADYLNSNPNFILKIRGHTDSRGSQSYNEELSRRRAQAVKTLLVSFGAPESQIQMKGLGEIVPVNDESKMQQNRRVELNYIDSTMMSAK